MRPITLEDRRQHLTKGLLWEESFHPFKNPKKNQILDEFDKRDITVEKDDKPSLDNQLRELMHGICRAPALMLEDPTKSAKELNIDNYEVMQFEPLHDITNVVQNLLTELPNHINNKDSKQLLERFTQKAIGGKNQLKGSDARRIMIKLTSFTNNLHSEGKITSQIREIVNSLVEIIHIAYSPEEKRCPKQILRLFNITFKFAYFTRNLVGKKPSKFQDTKFYGSHFHGLTSHLPEAYRLINTKSVLTEDEERSFGQLRRISENTSNRKPGEVIDNAVLRFNCQEQSDERMDSLKKQESEIGRLGKSLPKPERTRFRKSLLSNSASLYQIHLSRIPEFLEVGKGVWWHYENESIVFHDGHDDPNFHDEGPNLLNFRSSSLQEVYDTNAQIWQNCINDFQNDNLSLPLMKLQLRNDAGKLLRVLPGKLQEGKTLF